MQIPVVLLWFVVVNVVYVTSVPVQQNIHSNNDYDVNKANKVDRNRFMTENNAPVEFVPWREEGVLKRVSGTISIATRTIKK